MKLGPEAQALVSTVKRAYQPSDADRARALESLRGRLGDAVVLGDGIVKSPVGARSFWSPASGLTVAGLMVLGGTALWLALRSRPVSTEAPPPATSSVTPAALPSAAEAPVSVPSETPPERAEPPATQPSLARPAPSRRVRDGLSEEVAIMSRAETDLHGGRPESALKALDEHQRKFGNGVLAEERTAARIQALCALGRTTEAEAQLARLARISPNSPHTERARQACRMKRTP
jgi:hypothetical protein